MATGDASAPTYIAESLPPTSSSAYRPPPMKYASAQDNDMIISSPIQKLTPPQALNPSILQASLARLPFPHDTFSPPHPTPPQIETAKLSATPTTTPRSSTTPPIKTTLKAKRQATTPSIPPTSTRASKNYSA